MPRIENVVKKFTVQTCVYWGNPVEDGYGGFTFDAAVEIACRWDEKQELKVGFDGNEFHSQAVVLVNIDVDRQGYLFNGTLADLAAYNTSKPKGIPFAFIIQQFEKIPAPRKNDDFVRTAFLYNQG